MTTNKGEVIRFRYNGGSNPGDERTVLVLEDGSYMVRAWDFAKEAIRNFTLGKMSEAVTLNPGEDDGVYHLNLACLSTDTQATISKDLSDKGWKLFITADSDELYAVMLPPPKPKSPSLQWYYALRCIGIYKNDCSCGISLSPEIDGSVTIGFSDKTIRNATTQDFLDALKEINII